MRDRLMRQTVLAESRKNIWGFWLGDQLGLRKSAGDFDGFLIGVKKGGAILAVAQVFIEGCTDRSTKIFCEVVGD